MGKGNLGVKAGSCKLWLVNSFEFWPHAINSGGCVLGRAGADSRKHEVGLSSRKFRGERTRDPNEEEEEYGIFTSAISAHGSRND